MRADNDGTITNCYNTGSVSGSSSVGGVCGGALGGTISNCYWLYDTSAGLGMATGYNGEATVTNCSSKTVAQMKALASTLGSDFKADTNNINNGYPILSWQ